MKNQVVFEDAEKKLVVVVSEIAEIEVVVVVASVIAEFESEVVE